MKVAFILRRANWLRTLGPIIDAALRDHDVEPEIVLFPENDPYKPDPEADSLPKKFLSQCPVVTMDSTPALVDHLRTVDAIITILGRAKFFADGDSPTVDTLWCCVFDALHSTYYPHRFDDADLTFWPTRHYMNLAMNRDNSEEEEFSAFMGMKVPRCIDSFSDRIEKSGRIVGYVRLDGYEYISPTNVRRRHGIDPGRPVVLLIPDAYRFDRLTPSSVNALYTSVWCRDSLLGRLMGALLEVRTIEALRRVFDPSFSASAVVRAVRGFCDQNDAQLIMAPRRRKEWIDRPFTDDEIEAADVIMEAGEEYPQTLMQGIAVADLVVCPYRSASVLEATGGAKPYITVDMPDSTNSEFEILLAHQHQIRANWPGMAWMIEAEDFTNKFASMGLNDFRIDSDRQADYVERHFGYTDGRCGERILDAVKESL